jgi:hypothetical protein
MRARATVGDVKFTATVKNGVVAVGLPEGTPVTVTIDEKDLEPGLGVALDERGMPIMTPELEAELAAAEAEADLGGGMSLDEFREFLRRIE